MHSDDTLQTFIQAGAELSKINWENQEFLMSIRSNNQWFTDENIRHAIQGILYMLEANRLTNWFEKYSFTRTTPKKVGVIMAGNIPFVGFHDLMCVLLSGHHLYAKASTDDYALPMYFTDLLCRIQPGLSHRIHWVDKLHDVDALLATGSDNAAAHFDYYFASKPRIIRRNRTSVAVLSGNETSAHLQHLGHDIFTYFGLGCRNISTLFVPEGYDFRSFFEAIFIFQEVMHHKKYMNNYEYHRAIFLLNKVPFLDNNFLIVKNDSQLHSPVGVLHYQTYTDIQNVFKVIDLNRHKIQCIASLLPIAHAIPFGRTQFPKPDDYADGVDTMKFLETL